ncbi:MAG TPA: saccharopine dehydrogenase NADP-binding domain-containing protein [Longimicrobiales bacterium]|nr:saccharopine dehydrogenase NADP-binding domain-containing protein [Longimicrobiales bacterium]
MSRALVYGANGYTGRLIARHAAAFGVQPALAGRNQAAVAAVARQYGLEHRSFALAEPAALDAGLNGVDVVLHCAGPFSQTSRPMAEACLRRGVHYLDITGEIEVMELLAGYDAQARAAGIMLMPGTGFDVVPSDCLALHLKERMPTATRLLLGIRGTGALSHGTATTMVEHRARGGVIRRNGQLVHVPTAWRTRAIDYGDGKLRTAITIPWGDVATAYYTTGIPNIEVYAAVPKAARYAAVAARYLGPVLNSAWVKKLLKHRIDARPAGPSEEQLVNGASFVWGRVEDAQGRAEEARLRGPNGYLLTAHTALLILKRVLSGDLTPGFQTPAGCYGSRLILEVAGTSLT